MPKLALAVLVVVLALAVGWLAWPQGEIAGDAAVSADDVAAAPEPAAAADEAPSEVEAPATAGEGDAGPERTELALPMPVATAEDGRGSVRGSVTWADSGEPIGEVEVRLQLSPTVNFVLRALRATADAAGGFTFDDVPANSYTLTCAWGGSRTVVVTSGKETLVRLAVPRGARVRGIVRDEHGQPIAAASIWLSEPHVPDAGAIVARSDAQGNFRLASVRGARWIGARAPGYRASAVSLVEAKPGEDRALELTLVRHDARVRGFVRDPLGNPAVGAIVVGSPPGDPAWQAGIDGSQQRAWVAVTETADRAGAFVLAGLPPGELAVSAHLPPWGKATARLTVGAGGLGDVVLSLPVAAQVEGRVTDGTGAPAALATLYFSRLHEIDLVWARTDADGKYAAAGVSPGDVPVQIWHANRLALTTSLSLSPGEARTFHPVLGVTGELRGQVVDARQQPLANFSVAVFRDQRALGETQTDPQGRFALDGVAAEPLTLRVGVPSGGNRARWTVLVVADVRPPRDDLVLVVPDDRLPSVTLTGSVLRADGQPAVGATLRAGGGEDRGLAEAVVDAVGQLRLEHMIPGSYWLSVHDPEHPTLLLGQRTLTARSEVDLGVLQLTAGGRVSVTPRAAAGQDLADLKIEAFDAEHRMVGSLQRAGDSLRSPVLPAGKLVLVLSGARIARARHEVAVQAGQETRIDLTVEAGWHRVVRAQLPAGAPVPRWVWATFYRGTAVLGGIGLERGEGGLWTGEAWLGPEDSEVWVGAEGQKLKGHAPIPGSLPSGAVVHVTLEDRR